MESKFVIVRCSNAGVHMGTLFSQSGQTVQLTDAKRLWRWRGANTLHEVSQKGVASDYTRISEPVPTITLTDALEVIPCSDKARETFGTRWGS